MPVTSHLVSGKVYDIFGSTLVSGATVTITHASISPALSAETNSAGEYVINLSGLASQWSVGDSLSITATKSGEGTKTETATISSGGGQTQNFTLGETSDFVYDTLVQDRTHLYLTLPVHYDGLKVTRLRPLPVQIENPLDKYQPADEDSSGDPQYFSFTDRLGNWYIQQYNIANGTFRYSKGISSYSTNWTNRTSLSYDYFHNVF